jgi:hypothetical protein
LQFYKIFVFRLGGQNVRDGAMVLAALAIFNREYFRIDFVA